MDTTLRDRLQAFLEKDKSPDRGSKLRERVAKILRNEEKPKDQRTPSGGDGGKPLGKVTRPDPLDAGGS